MSSQSGNPTVAHGADLNAMTFKNIFGVMKLTIQTRSDASIPNYLSKPQVCPERQDFTENIIYDPA